MSLNLDTCITIYYSWESGNEPITGDYLPDILNYPHMKVIEVIGPSGSGKTTYVSNIPDENKIHVDRMQTFTKSLPAGTILQALPVQESVARRIFTYVRHRYEQKFFSQFPGVLETVASIVQNSRNKRNMLNNIFREAAWFEFFSTHIGPEERYIVDDGLYQFHLDLLPKKGWDAEEIMDRLPEPNKIIFIDAPAEVCLDRQESRERGRASELTGIDRSRAIDKLEAMRESSKRIIAEARNRGIEAEVVNNA